MSTANTKSENEITVRLFRHYVDENVVVLRLEHGEKSYLFRFEGKDGTHYVKVTDIAELKLRQHMVDDFIKRL